MAVFGCGRIGRMHALMPAETAYLRLAERRMVRVPEIG